jgi:8-oxo-dGTP diphosphatase
MNSTDIVTVVAAVIRGNDGRMLITKRFDESHLGGLWEFPGGKVEDGETLRSALVREIREELGVGIEVGRLVLEQKHAYPDRRVHLHFFECRILDGAPVSKMARAMTWASPSELAHFEFPSANRRLLDKLRASNY